MLRALYSKTRQRAIFSIAILLILFSSALAQDIGRKADEYLRENLKLERFSGSVLIAQKGQVLLSKGYGMANLELNIPNTPQTVFRLGSVTKQFTAMAILQLEERKVLNVADPVEKFLPGYPQGARITIHHLLTHTAGIPNFTFFPEYQKAKLQPSPPLKTIALFREKPLEFAPGEKFNYSNSGYILLTAIIVKASEKPYEQFLKENIFNPLKMENTGYDNSSRVVKNRSRGYSRRNDKIVNAPFIDMSIPAGAGGLYSTVEDLYLWDRSLTTDKLIGRPALERMFTAFLNNYGYGWEVTSQFGRKRLSHGGGIEGYSANFSRYPDDDVCIIVLSNYDFAPTAEIRDNLAAIVFGEKPKLPSSSVRTPGISGPRQPK